MSTNLIASARQRIQEYREQGWRLDKELSEIQVILDKAIAKHEWAAIDSPPHTVIGARDVTQHYASEAKPSESAGNLNEPREAAGLDNLTNVLLHFNSLGLNVEIRINNIKQNVSPSRS